MAKKDLYLTRSELVANALKTDSLRLTEIDVKIFQTTQVDIPQGSLSHLVSRMIKDGLVCITGEITGKRRNKKKGKKKYRTSNYYALTDKGRQRFNL